MDEFVDAADPYDACAPYQSNLTPYALYCGEGQGGISAAGRVKNTQRAHDAAAAPAVAAYAAWARALAHRWCSDDAHLRPPPSNATPPRPTSTTNAGFLGALQ